MSPAAPSHSLPVFVLWAGTITGSVDLCAALIFAATRGTKPKLVLQAIASALVGPRAFSQGATVPLGLAPHYFIAFTVAATYAVVSRYLPVVTEHSVSSGLLYGAAVYLFMAFVVLPLSRLNRPFSMSFFLGQLVINMFCVGLPTALVIRHFS
jgi:uncharacterized membrane protein YagU involved in acid resistance